MQKKIAMALAVVVSVLAGCSFGLNRGPTEVFVNEPAPTGATSSSQTDFRCGQPKGATEDTTIIGDIHFGEGGISSPITDYGYEVKGRAWLSKKTGDYCVEEGGYVKFPNRPRIEGPKRGNSYKEQGKAVCYTDKIIMERCAHKRPSGNLLLLSQDWFKGRCDGPLYEKVVQLLAKHKISLEDPRWENCDIAGAWKGIDLSK